MPHTDGQMSSAEAQAAKLQGILETAVIAIDERGLIETVNPATERLFGYDASELVGHNVKMLMPEPYRTEHDGYIVSYLRTGTRKDHRHRAGGERPAQGWDNVSHSPGGQRVRGRRAAPLHRHDP